MATPVYVDYDDSIPVAADKSITELADDVRDNLNALLDAADNSDVLAVRSEYGYDSAPDDTRVTEIVTKRGARWIKTAYTYGTSGAGDRKPTSAAITYSTDSGVSWVDVRTKTWAWVTTGTGKIRLDYTEGT